MKMRFEHLFDPDPPPIKSINLANSVISDGRMFRYDYIPHRDSPVAVLEDEFAKCIGKQYALAVNSCGSALQLGLISAGVNPGDKILVPGFTFTAVISAIMNSGCKPILVDIEDDYCISLKDLKNKYNNEIKFLLMSYMRGRVARLEEVLEFCEQHSIRVIEDCAHSLGSNWNGKPTGAFGLLSCFSFHDKLLSGGEGGVLLTDSADILMKATVMSGTYEDLWSRHISCPKEQNVYQGNLPQFSMRMSAVTASILVPQVELIDSYAADCRERYNLLSSLLAQSPKIRIPIIDYRAELVCNSIQFEISCFTGSQSDSFLASVQSAGIPLARLGLKDRNERCFWNWHYLGEELQESVPVCWSILPKTFDLKIRRRMTTDDIVSIATVILNAVSEM